MAECEAKERKILVGVDEGEESMYALSWCLNNILVSQNSKDTLVLCYAKPPRPVSTAIDGTGYMFSPNIIATMDKYANELVEFVMEKAKRLLKEFHNLDVKVEKIVESGDPRDVICLAAETLGVDMVVLGSHGYGLMKRAFVGSVSNHCAQKAKCPVLIVKMPKSTCPSK
ncbi:Universal stress protein A-like protein [Camellia lanceoleosa]|uniref:Universal stress protein A-like protein n=1 Tax=Camellia lanceoleosa TaxID=1840588 RepID=A0ACC0I9G5_9ERIC|nr:Universal stress protein A-like protein [Camellia lanceoleosa]